MVEGNCSICGADLIKTASGRWVCPNFYRSALHNCDAVIYHYRDGISMEEALDREITYIEHTYGCTIEEYLKARLDHAKKKGWVK